MPIENLVKEYERGRLFFSLKDYTGAARIRAGVVAQVPDDLAARLLPARAHYHSAQLRRAESELRLILERDPAEEYAYPPVEVVTPVGHPTPVPPILQ